jgi:hypothetical protein
VSSGELGTQAPELEKQLHDILEVRSLGVLLFCSKSPTEFCEMATAWKAVVLIDEVSFILTGYGIEPDYLSLVLQADVFLEARNTFDITRNSLVSVFLRVLEYHTGGR